MPAVANSDGPLERDLGVSPIQIGTWPAGCGLARMLWKRAPWTGNSAVMWSSVHIRRIISMASSVRGPRSANGTPRASNSASSHPAAVPRITRPPLSWSMVAIDFATTTGPRIGRTSTVVPIRTRDVAAATHDITANGSRTYAEGGYGTPAGTTRWSLTQTSAKPSSSARRAVRVSASPEAAGPAWGRWTPPVIDADSVIDGTVPGRSYRTRSEPSGVRMDSRPSNGPVRASGAL